MEVCANCERKIGKLETPYLFNMQTVCKECHSLLAGEREPDVSRSVVAEVEARRAAAEMPGVVQSTWSPEASKRLDRVQAQRKKAPNWFVVIWLSAIAVVVALLVVNFAVGSSGHVSQTLVVVLACVAGIPLLAMVLWAPVSITKAKGRTDKVDAIMALSLLGAFVGVLWLAALIWSLALETRNSRHV